MTRVEALAICKKIRPQFPKTGEAQLFLGVIECAVMDLVPSNSIHAMDVASARNYLASDMPHAQHCGVDPDWIRSIVEAVEGADCGA